MNVIAEITDDMFEIEPIPFNNPKVRYGARGIVKTQDGLIAVFFKKAKNEYKLPGGGIEQGETPEEAFTREVLEEVGIKIKNLQYKRSQTWPFPNSLMFGFSAEYESGDIKVDGDEILTAKWIKKEDVEPPETDISIASWLIEEFLKS